MLPWFSKRGRVPGWLALAPGAETIAALHVDRPGEGPPRVTRFDLLPGGDDGAARQREFRRYRATTLLPTGEYQLVQAEAPALEDREELKTAMRWRVKDLIDFPPDQAQVDVLEIPGQRPGAQRQVYVVAARMAAVRERLEQLSAARLPLDVVDIQELAQRNLANLIQQPGRGVALLAFGERAGTLTFSCDGELLLARHLDISLGQLAGADGEQRERLFDRIGLELQRSLDNFDRAWSSVPVNRLVLAPLPEGMPLQSYLADTLTVPVEQLDLAEIVDLSAAPLLAQPAVQARHFHLLGAALRDAKVV